MIPNVFSCKSLTFMNIILRIFLKIHFTSPLKRKQGRTTMHCLRTADFTKKGTWSVHSFNDDYLSIPERPGS